MKTIYLIGLIVLIETLILGGSNIYEKNIQKNQPIEGLIFETPPRELIRKPLSAKERPKKPEIKCDISSITANMDHTYYKHNSPTNNNPVKIPILSLGLNLKQYGLIKLPNEVLNANCIRNINLQRNFLTTFPTELLAQSYLVALDLSHNEITKFPHIEAPTSITYLNLSGNPIKEIPSSIQFFTQLEYLYLEDIPNLIKIHPDIKKLKRLKYLAIRKTPIGQSYNQITKLRELLPNTIVLVEEDQ